MAHVCATNKGNRVSIESLEGALGKRIGDQATLYNNYWSRKDIPSIAEFFWQPRNQQMPTSWGCAAAGKYRHPLIPQLLATPHLIVDIYDDNEQGFCERYGVTIEQMRALVEEGFITPLIYIRKNDNWKRYATNAPLAALLIEHGRPHSDLIELFLNRKYDFDELLKREEEFFRELLIPAAERPKVTATTHGSVARDDWNMTIAYFAQRLAYISALGNADQRKVLDSIRNRLQSNSGRMSALSALNGAKSLIVSNVTAAFGGRLSIAVEQHEDIERAALDLAGVTTIDYADHHENLYAESLLRRSARVFPVQPEEIRWPLEPAAFAQYLSILRQVRNGEIGTHIFGLKKAITQQAVERDITVKSYLEREREFDRMLRPLGRLASVCDGIAGYAFGVSRLDQPGPPPEVSAAMTFIGLTCQLVSSRARSAEFLPLLPGEDRVICGNWRKVRTQLEVRSTVSA